jgi:hypothetical protein
MPTCLQGQRHNKLEPFLLGTNELDEAPSLNFDLALLGHLSEDEAPTLFLREVLVVVASCACSWRRMMTWCCFVRLRARRH